MKSNSSLAAHPALYANAWIRAKIGFGLEGGIRKIAAAKKEAAKARAGKKSFPPTPFLFARPSVRFGAPQLRGRQFRSKNVRILSNKRTNNNT